MYKFKLLSAYLPLIIFVFITSCKEKSKQSQAVPHVPVIPYTIREAEVTFYDTYPGTVTATDEVQLRSQVSGFITGIYFKEGSHVKKDMKLYEIDRRKYQAAFESAKSAVEIANSNLQKAQRDADRYKKLDEQNAIAKQVLEDALTALQNAQEQVKSSKANLVNTQTDYNYSLITAPFSGSIGLSLVKPGAFVTAGQTLLNTISSDDPIAVDFMINEKSLPYIVRLQNVKSTKLTENQDSTFKLTLPDNTGYKYHGKLSIIDRAVDPQTGTIRVRVVFPNPERILRPGINCVVKVLNEYSGKQINIPYRAVVEQMGEYFVYLISANDTVKQKKVQVGPAQGQSIIVKSGLNPGDRIVLEGIQKIHQGSVVDTAKNPNTNPAGPGGNVQRNTQK